MVSLLGNRDDHVRLIEAAFPQTRISVRGNEFSVSGPDAAQAATVIEELIVLVSSGEVLDAGVVSRSIAMVRADERPSRVLTTEVLKAGRGRSVRPKTSGQKRYV